MTEEMTDATIVIRADVTTDVIIVDVMTEEMTERRQSVTRCGRDDTRDNRGRDDRRDNRKNSPAIPEPIVEGSEAAEKQRKR